MSWVIKHLYHTFLGDSQNYQPRGAVDHRMNYQVVHSTLGQIVLTVAQKGMT